MPAGAVQVLGGLDTVVSPAGFVVQPIVGLVASGTGLVAAPDEVARVLLDAQHGHRDLSIDGFWLVFSDPEARRLGLGSGLGSGSGLAQLPLPLSLPITLTRPAACISASSRRAHARCRSS